MYRFRQTRSPVYVPPQISHPSNFIVESAPGAPKNQPHLYSALLLPYDVFAALLLFAISRALVSLAPRAASWRTLSD